jgi:drug/metabolite transporter (DMT)-like permease
LSNFDFSLSKEPRPLVISIALFTAILAVSTASLFIRFAQSEVPSLVIAAYRLSLAAVFTAFFIRRKELHEIQVLDRKKWKLNIISGLFL